MVRMIYSVLGEAHFQEGLQLYFSRRQDADVLRRVVKLRSSVNRVCCLSLLSSTSRNYL